MTAAWTPVASVPGPIAGAGHKPPADYPIFGANPDGICSLRAFPLLTDTVDKIDDGRAAALMPHARPAAAVCCLRLRATSNATELYLRQLMFKQSSHWVVAARSGSPVF